MPDCKSMYFTLAAKLANVIDTLDKLSENLKDVQREQEDSYINADESCEN